MSVARSQRRGKIKKGKRMLMASIKEKVLTDHGVSLSPKHCKFLLGLGTDRILENSTGFK